MGPALCKAVATSRMPTMTAAVCIALTLLASPMQGQKKGDKTSAPSIPTTNADVARGKYLVENVAMCGQCHTPRDNKGALEQNRALEGSPVILRPAIPDPNWPINAPRIAGNPPASDEDIVKLLTTGIWTDGKPLRFPMMPFRMSEGDAKAVLAYLKSLPPQR